MNKAKKAAHKGQPEVDGANSKKGESTRRSVTFALSSLRKRLLSAVAPNPEDKGLEPRLTDDDPEGLKLVLNKDSLERADKYLAGLTELVPRNLEVCFATYDVAIRRSKWNLRVWS